MEIKLPVIIDAKVNAMLDMDDIIAYINAKPLQYRFNFIRKIIDQVQINELTDPQREKIKTWLQTELKKLS